MKRLLGEQATDESMHDAERAFKVDEVFRCLDVVLQQLTAFIKENIEIMREM